MSCPECGERFPSEAILHRHRVFEHPHAVERERAAKEAAAAQERRDEEQTDDGFLRRASRRPERPSIFPSFRTTGQELPPWERERLARDG